LLENALNTTRYKKFCCTDLWYTTHYCLPDALPFTNTLVPVSTCSTLG